MVPPMFYGEVPEAIKLLADYKSDRNEDRVKGDFAESNVYYALKEYYANAGDDVLICHSHKFLNDIDNYGTLFLVLNLTKG